VVLVSETNGIVSHISDPLGDFEGFAFIVKFFKALALVDIDYYQLSGRKRASDSHNRQNPHDSAI